MRITVHGLVRRTVEPAMRHVAAVLWQDMVAAGTEPFGSRALSAKSGRLVIKTARAGFGAMAGHDLTIEATRWAGSANVGPAGLEVRLVAADLSRRIDRDPSVT